MAASLALHAFVLSLQFGVPGLGLSLSDQSGAERRASIPTLQAALPPQPKPSIAQAKTRPPAAATGATPEIKLRVRRQVEPIIVPVPQVEVGITTVDKADVKPQPTPAPEIDKPRVIARNTELERVPDRQGVSVLDTDKDSAWSVNAAKAAQEAEEQSLNEQVESERAKEAEAFERKEIEQAESQRKAELAAIAKATDEALERRRSEEERAAAEQAALARARQEAAERARLAKEKAEHETIVKAREEALARKVEAEALARTQAQASAKPVAAAGETKATDEPVANSLSNPAGRGEGKAGPQVDRGSSLASRALDQARSGLPGSFVRQPAAADRQRRGSILGRDPTDIQLAFYGEGWRQKVERIGSLNFPKLSPNRHYDPLVVTVSINSDGTLAGVRIDKSSGHKDIDDSVRRIVEMSAPFAAFPPAMKRSYDVVDITRSWNFIESRARIYSQ